MNPDTRHPFTDLPLIFLGIAICLWFLWYLFVAYPATCAKYEWMTHGAFTCGLGPGAYILGLGLGLSLIVFGYVLYSALMRSLE